VAPVQAWAERDPDRLLFQFLDIDGHKTESYTRGQFIQRTADIASYVHRRLRLAPGERVLLAYPPGLEMICAFFACLRIGLIPVPVYPPSNHGFEGSLRKMNLIASDCDASAVLSDRAYFWSMKLNRTRRRIGALFAARDKVSTIPWVVSSNATQGSTRAFQEACSEVAFLQYTSGSTSDPKGVMITHANILDNCDAVVDHDPIGVSWLPQYHDMGLFGYYVFVALKGGTTYGFSPVDFLQRPALWLETLSKYRATASSAPNFAYEYCLRPDKIPPETFEGLDLSALSFLMTAAEPVRPKVYRDFLARFEPYGLKPKAFSQAYGLAEFTVGVANHGRTIQRFDRDSLNRNVAKAADKSSTDVTTLQSCGTMLGSGEARIVDVSGTPRALQEGGVGEIWLRGPSKCRGYWGRPELTAEVFEAALATEQGEGNAWLRTGDLGFLHGGELFVCGRLKDLLIVRGQNYYPQDVERLVEEDEAIRKGCVAAFGYDKHDRERLAVVAELKSPKRLPDTTAIGHRVLSGLGIAVDTFVYIQPRTIPKTSSGKIIRHLTCKQYVDGSLQVISEVTANQDPDSAAAIRPLQEDEVTQRKLAGFNLVLAKYGITGRETRTLPESGLDSLTLVEFSLDLQKHLRREGLGDLADAVDLRVLQKIAICELVELLHQLALASQNARLRFKKVLSDLEREHRELEQEMMRTDVHLCFDPAALPKEAGAGSRILLTGATGFFGPFLLASLLEQTSDEIYVLARAENEQQALDRIGEALQSLGLPGGAPRGWDARVRPVCGDLARVNLGLGSALWKTLATEAHAIYHNGAMVHYLFDYATMREANVGGTNEVIRLAMSHRPAVLNHISTTFIFGWSTKDVLFETDRNEAMELLDFGYSQSKWVSEQVVFDAMRQGLNARVFRPALITPSLRGGGFNLDISVRLLAFMLNHRIGTTAQNQVSFSPADSLADNVVAISQLPESLNHTLHATRDTYANMSDITAILSELTKQPFTNFALEDFVPEVIARCQPGDILFPLLEFLVRSTDNITAMEFKRYDSHSFMHFRNRLPNSKADPPLRDVIQGILRFMRRQGIVHV
jgi:thioester reductase-like protein